MELNQTIALFTPSLAGGGAERVMLSLARGFVDRGYSVDMVLSTPAGQYFDQVDRRVRIVHLGAKRVLSSLPGLIKYIRRNKPHAILATQAHANVVALIARSLSGVPTRIIVRDSNSVAGAAGHVSNTISARIANALARHLYVKADGVVAVCQDMKDEIRQRTTVPLDKITVIYNPVDMDTISRKVREPSGNCWLDAPTRKVILSVGRLEEQKDFASLIRAVSIVRQKVDVCLVILGDGRLRRGLIELAESLGLQDFVDLPGFVDNPYSFIARADVFVLSSLFEGLPNVLLEALAVGTPIVATDCRTGPREILRDGKDGRLVPIKNPSALADAIVATLGSEGRPATDAESLLRFTLGNVVDQYLRLLVPQTRQKSALTKKHDPVEK